MPTVPLVGGWLRWDLNPGTLTTASLGSRIPLSCLWISHSHVVGAQNGLLNELYAVRLEFIVSSGEETEAQRGTAAFPGSHSKKEAESGGVLESRSVTHQNPSFPLFPGNDFERGVASIRCQGPAEKTLPGDMFPSVPCRS